MQSSTNIWNDGAIITLRNQCSGRFLQTSPSKTINVGGTEGRSTFWKVRRTNSNTMPAHVRLESVEHKGEYLHVTEGGLICLSPAHCDFKAEPQGSMFILEPVMRPKMYVGGNSDGTIRLPKDTHIGDHARFTVCQVE